PVRRASRALGRDDGEAVTETIELPCPARGCGAKACRPFRQSGERTMSGKDADTRLTFPFQDIPQPGQAVTIRDGVLWARIPLPYRLDHVNVYLVRDHDAWTLIDTGINTAEARAAWENLFTGAFRGLPISKVIVTHHHPDHIGLAGWLCERFGAELLTSQTGYLGCINISLDPGAFEAQHYHDFYRRHGMSLETATLVATQGHAYLGMVTPLPPTFRRLV